MHNTFTTVTSCCIVEARLSSLQPHIHLAEPDVMALQLFVVSCLCSVTQVSAFGNIRPHVPAVVHQKAVVTAMMAAPSDTATENQKTPSFSLAYPLTQVVSDIDDTLKSSGGVEVAGISLGGIDVQYKRGHFYPGVFQFMWELSLHSVTINQRYYTDHLNEWGGGNDGSSDLQISPPKVAVLTARAGELVCAEINILKVWCTMLPPIAV